MMTPKKLRFCEEYLIDLNATQAAIRAGYSVKTATEQGSRLLTDVDVHAYIAKLQQERSQRTAIDADFVLISLKEVAERCMQKVPVMVFDFKDKRMVQKKDDDDKDVWQFDSTGANRSLELLGKHLGIFEKDNDQKKKDVVVNIS